MLLKKDDTVSTLVEDARSESEIDISLLEHNLSLSYEQRLLEHQSALDLFAELREAGQALKARQHENRSK